MNKIRLACVCAGVLLLGLLIARGCPSPTADTVSFPDVTPSQSVLRGDRGLGFPRHHWGASTTGSFRPGDPVTRQQFAKMVVLACGYPVTERDYCYFWDVQKERQGGVSTRTTTLPSVQRKA